MGALLLVSVILGNLLAISVTVLLAIIIFFVRGRINQRVQQLADMTALATSRTKDQSLSSSALLKFSVRINVELKKIQEEQNTFRESINIDKLNEPRAFSTKTEDVFKVPDNVYAEASNEDNYQTIMPKYGDDVFDKKRS